MSSELSKKITKALQERHALQRYLCRRWLFPVFEKLGVHVVGNHFYEPIAATEEIKAFYRDSIGMPSGHTQDETLWSERHGALFSHHGAECLAEITKYGYECGGYFFRPADALVWYCLLRERKPSLVIEIGQGDSTRTAFAALARNSQEGAPPARFISIDPYDRLGGLAQTIPGLHFESKQQRIQEIEPAWLLEQLASEGGNGILFVDSSHVYKPGSDVEYLQREIYPGLPAGSLLHIHDILLPFRWKKDWLLGPRWFWNEQDLLEAFLSFNHDFSTLLPLFFLSTESAAFRESVADLMKVKPEEVIGYSYYLERTLAPLS